MFYPLTLSLIVLSSSTIFGVSVATVHRASPPLRSTDRTRKERKRTRKVGEFQSPVARPATPDPRSLNHPPLGRNSVLFSPSSLSLLVFLCLFFNKIHLFILSDSLALTAVHFVFPQSFYHIFLSLSSRIPFSGLLQRHQHSEEGQRESNLHPRSPFHPLFTSTSRNCEKIFRPEYLHLVTRSYDRHFIIVVFLGTSSLQ